MNNSHILIHSFDCPNLIDRDNSKCYYRDKTLLPGEVLENFQQSDTCEGKCYCNLNRAGGPSEIFCNRLKCSDKRPANQKTQKCVQQYENGNCCPVNAVCGKKKIIFAILWSHFFHALLFTFSDDDINELATCEFEGKTYREGERMFPKKYCYKCFCGKNFNSQTPVPENRNCFKIDCGIALTKTRRLSEGCIPVYIKTDDCCPIGWRCPGDKHMSEPAKLDLSLDKCRFGNMMLKVGEALDLGGDNCQNCTCTMPPMLHCIQTC